MRFLKKQLMVALLCTAPVIMASAQSYNDRDDSPRVSVGLNASVPTPSVELGVCLSPSFSLHARGGYLPNVQKTPSHLEIGMGDLFARWWQDGSSFQGFFVDMGLSGVYMDILQTKWIRSQERGLKGWGIGILSGVGYSFSLGEHVRFVPFLDLAVYPYPRIKHYYVGSGEGDGTTVSLSKGSSLPVLMLPTLGVGVHYTF